MPLAAGTRLGPHEIVAPIGKGGMGEVYRARDTKLDRDVAIKVLSEPFAQDEERLARFEREAKLLASLNHPNIASIYGFEEAAGVRAIVLELVEGPTLAERIERGPIPVDEALAIAKQIAEALERGHEAGVIHRDLKPANIKLRDDGTVKVLDYGLAKALEGEAPSAPDARLSQSPTLTRQTEAGMILGTAAYMSPEQAKGGQVDRRADIWAFGAVVYEMLTGKRAFAGEDVSDTLAAVLRAEPDFGALPAEIPESRRRALQLCLKKDARERLHDMADVRLAMAGAFETTASPENAASREGRWRRSTAVAFALALGLVTGVAVWQGAPPAETPRPIARFTVPLPPGVWIYGRERRVVALSPDGARLVFTGYIEGDITTQRLYLRTIDQTEPTPISGTVAAAGPFFSPDGQWIGFYADGQLQKVAISGGAPVRLCDAKSPWGASWGADDTIVFGQRGVGILQVSADGGTPEVVIPLEQEEEVAHGPQLLPGENAVLYTLGDGRNWDEAHVVVHSLESGERKVLIEGGRDARYVLSGHLVYVLEGSLMAVPFDVDALEVTGAPVPMAEGIRTSESDVTGAAQFGVSDTGVLVYWVASDPETRTLVWVDREGREEALAAEPAAYSLPRISPDGGRLVLVAHGVSLPGRLSSSARSDDDLWLWDFGREAMTRLTLDPGRDLYPAWTPDGTRIAFASDRDGTVNLYRKAADGSGAAERLNQSEHVQYPLGFTPEGNRLVYTEMRHRQDRDLGVLPLDGSPEPLLDSEFLERNGELSPGGRWLAYQSNASGQYEIYVRPFPNVDEGRWSISSGGGTRPLWAPDGRELFYTTPDGTLMAVPVTTEPGFAPGNAEALFSGYFVGHPGRTYDISSDGERFLMIQESSDRDATEFILVLNWFDELKRLVPTDD